MVHDDRRSDLWYHDAIMPTCIIGNWLHVLRDHSMSEAERKITIDKALNQVENNREIIYTEYLEKRRTENILRSDEVEITLKIKTTDIDNCEMDLIKNYLHFHPVFSINDHGYEVLDCKVRR